MTLAASIFGSETRLRPLIRGFLTIAFLRAIWIGINTYNPTAPTLAWALIPWPWWMYSWTVWIPELALVFYQLRATIRLGRLLLLRYAPGTAAFLGFAERKAGDNNHLRPRNRSWMPTALQLCGVVILTCSIVTWITLMLYYRVWVPFDSFMFSQYANGTLMAGFGLSVLAFLFGGRHIARASGDVSTSFGVTRLDDDHWLTQRVHGLAEKLNLPLPAVGVTNVMNAFAMGANQKTSMVVIGTPLFAFDKDELDAIIGHELGHILHNDVARMQFAEGFQQMLVKVVNTVTVFGAILAASSMKSRASARMSTHLVRGSGALVRQTVFVGSELMAKGISRNREFHADAVGAHVTSTDAMIRALQRVHGVATKPTAEESHYGYLMFRGARFGNLFSTHPQLAARVAALEGRERSAASEQGSEEQNSAQIAESLEAAMEGELSGHWDEKSSKLGFRPTGISVLPSPGLWKIIANTARWIRLWSWKPIAIGLFAILVLFAIAPALNSYYQIDRRLRETTGAVTSSTESYWASLASSDMLGRLTGSSKVIASKDTEIAQLKTDVSKSASDLAAIRLDREQLANRVDEQEKLFVRWGRERDQTRQQIQDLQNQLNQQISRSTRITTTTVADPAQTQLIASLQYQLKSLQADNQALNSRIATQQQLTSRAASNGGQSDEITALRIDREHLANRVDEQEKLFSRWQQERTETQQEIEMLKAQLARSSDVVSGGPSPTPAPRLDPVTADLQTQVSTLQTVNASLTARINEQSKTISDGAVDAIQVRQQVADLQKAAALRDAQQQPQRTVWGGAAVNSSGGVYALQNQFADKDVARDVVALCEGRSHKSCELLRTYQNSCISVARAGSNVGLDNFRMDVQPTWAAARDSALNVCLRGLGRDCHTVFTACSPDSLAVRE